MLVVRKNMERKNFLRRLKAPTSAKKGEIITIKTMAEHVMEPGVRRDPETGLVLSLIHI